MNTQTEALKLALDFLMTRRMGAESVIDALQEALAQQPAQQEDVASQFDIQTSNGGRGFVEWYFKSVLNRHDFTDYIRTALAADFSCALAKGLSTSPQPLEQEPVGMVKDLFTTTAWEKLDVVGSTKVYLNPSPAQPLVVPDLLTAHDPETPEYRNGWNDCRQLMMEMYKREIK